MSHANFYPEVHTADAVLFATNPHAQPNQWRLGQVCAEKVNSCDIVIFASTGTEYRHDCFHIDDPRCKSTRLWAESGRGVFKLAPVELARRESQRLLEALAARIGLLEQTMESVVTTAQGTSKPSDSFSPAAKPRRGRPPKSQPIRTES